MMTINQKNIVDIENELKNLQKKIKKSENYVERIDLQMQKIRLYKLKEIRKSFDIFKLIDMLEKESERIIKLEKITIKKTNI